MINEQINVFFQQHQIISIIFSLFFLIWCFSVVLLPYAIHGINNKLGKISDSLEKISKIKKI